MDKVWEEIGSAQKKREFDMWVIDIFGHNNVV